jgi:hypothetical protein
MILYKDIDELISLAFNALQDRPDADMIFIDSVTAHYRRTGKLSPAQIKALENIAYKELGRRREMGNNLTLF